MHHMILFTFIFTGWLSFTFKKGLCQQAVIVRLPNSSLFLQLLMCTSNMCALSPSTTSKPCSPPPYITTTSYKD